MQTVPELSTDRLILRAFVASDFEAYASIMADPAVTQILGEGLPLTRVDSWRQLAMILGHWTLRGFGLWAVEHRANGRLLGRIGCHEPEGFPAFEVGTRSRVRRGETAMHAKERQRRCNSHERLCTGARSPASFGPPTQPRSGLPLHLELARQKRSSSLVHLRSYTDIRPSRPDVR